MKLKATLILFLGLAISISAFSQFSAGPEIGFSMSTSSSIGAAAFGGSIRYEATIKNNLSWTCSAGYLSFFENFQDGFPTRIKMVPISGGIKYYFSAPNKGLYAAADLGLNFISITTSYPPPFPWVSSKTYLRSGFSSGIGYRAKRWDFAARYHLFAWVYDERYDSRINANYISLRAAYVFRMK